MPEPTVVDTANRTDDDFDDDADKTADLEKKFTQADIDRIVSERVARTKAQFSDYGDLKKKAAAAMSDQEKQVTEAEQRGASTERARYGIRLARAEFKAEAAGKVAADALDGFLEYADLNRFVGDDGEPDSKAITAAIRKLGTNTTERARPSTNYDGGARSSAEAPRDMNAMIRRQAGLG